MCPKNVKNIKFVASDVFFQASNAPKPVFGHGSARIPLGNLPIPFPLDGLGVSISTPKAPFNSQEKFPAMLMH